MIMPEGTAIDVETENFDQLRQDEDEAESEPDYEPDQELDQELEDEPDQELDQDETEKARIRGLKKTRTKRLAATLHTDPETDNRFTKARKTRSFHGAIGLVAAVLAHGGTGNTLTWVDPGPHPRGSKRDPGWENCPQTNVERAIAEVAENHDLALPEALVRDAAEKIAESFDHRMNMCHARIHRAINSIAWLLLVQEYGLEQAQELKSTIQWWLTREGTELDLANEDAEPELEVVS